MNTILFVGEHPKTYDVRWHTHEHWELVYCTGGKGAFRFESGNSFAKTESDPFSSVNLSTYTFTTKDEFKSYGVQN